MSLLVTLGQPKWVEPPELGSEKQTQQQQQKKKFVRSTKTMEVKKEVVARQQAGVRNEYRR